MMFFRIRKFRARNTNLPADEDLPYRSALTKFAGDLSVFRFNAVAAKIWLPEVVDEILKQLSDHWPSSSSEMIRDTLFVYVYGQYAFAQMRAEKMDSSMSTQTRPSSH